MAAGGWTGSFQAGERYVRQFRGADGCSWADRNPLQAPPAIPLPKTREVTRWLLTRPDNLGPADQARLDVATAQCPHLDDLARHARAFGQIMARRQGLTELEGWLASAEASDLPQLRSFARGIRRDQQAVTAGLSLPCSSAALEGNVHKSSSSSGKCSAAQGSRPAQARHPPPGVTGTTELAEGPEIGARFHITRTKSLMDVHYRWRKCASHRSL
jgi:hypothetical protein